MEPDFIVVLPLFYGGGTCMLDLRQLTVIGDEVQFGRTMWSVCTRTNHGVIRITQEGKEIIDERLSRLATVFGLRRFKLVGLRRPGENQGLPFEYVLAEAVDFATIWKDQAYLYLVGSKSKITVSADTAREAMS